MRRLTTALLLLVAAVFAVPPTAQAQAGFERITAYDVAIVVDASGEMLVRETIDYDFGATPRHGIFRDIPVRSQYDSKHDRILPIDVVSVEGSPGTPDEYKVEDEGNTKRIRVGDPDRTITGAHQYTLEYRVRGAVTSFPGHDELYWNAIGTYWTVPILTAVSRVNVPAPVEQVACFTGPEGSNLPCAESRFEGRSASFVQADLAAGSGLAVVVGFPKGSVVAPGPILEERWSFARAFQLTPLTVGASAALLFAVVGLVVWLAWRTGRDRRWAGSPVDAVFGPGAVGAAAAQAGGEQERPVELLDRTPTPVEFVPPDGLRPGQIGTLVDEEANPLDVTATIVDLAVRGHLRITEISKQGWFGKPDWQLTKLGPGPSGPSERETSKDQLLPYEQALLDGLFEGGVEVKLSELRNVFAARLEKVQDALYDDAVARGWFRTRPDRTRNIWTFLGISASIIGAGILVVAAVFTHVALIAVPLVVGGLLLWIFAKRMPRRTAKGTGVLRQVQGFRRFIVESERERARFAERKNLFTEYLPYAIVFGCTERWARTFAGLEGELPAPSWYVGSGYYTPLVFAHSLDGFTVSTAGTITSTPSGSSGFSGGSSGGGGGGGGGGSW